MPPEDRSSDRVQHLEAEVAVLRDEMQALSKEVESFRDEISAGWAEYRRHMLEDCGGLATELANIKDAWAQFTTALQKADQHELKKLTKRISDLMTTAGWTQTTDGQKPDGSSPERTA